MAFIDAFKTIMGIRDVEENEEIGYEDEDEVEAFDNTIDYEDDYDQQEAVGGGAGFSSIDTLKSISNTGHSTYIREGMDNVVNISRNTDNGEPQVVIINPTKFEEASVIADHMQSKKTIIVNTDAVTPDVKRRLIDFLSGVAYAENVTIKKASSSTFVMTPNTVGIMGDGVAEESDKHTNDSNYY